jgi:hypothetical protein
MKRALVLTDETARHPFRARLKPAVAMVLPAKEPMTDLAFFIASFISCFVIIYGLIL